MNKKFQAAALAIAVAAVGGQAWGLEPQGYKTAEGLVITPAINVSERWDDNFRAVEKGEESSWITTINPYVNLGVKGRKAEFNLNFDVSHDSFHSSSSDDNTDRKAAANLAMEFDARNRLRLDAGFKHVEETASLAQKLQNDVYEIKNANALYGYGAETARGQIELGVGQEELRFKNDLVLLDGSILNKDRERDAKLLKGTFYVALAPRTKALAEVRRTRYEYVTMTARDSTNTALLGGIKWEASAKTSGSIKAGTEKKEFEVGGDKSNAMWEAVVTWSPLSYSTFTLMTNSAFNEGMADAAAIEAQSISLSWDHQWLKRLKSNANVTTSNQDYVVPAGTPARADELLNVGLGVTYNVRRWLDVGVGYKFSRNESNAAGQSFERNIVGVNVAASL